MRPAATAHEARAGVARVYPLVTARAVDRPFDYRVPEGLELERGTLVEVPLGARSVAGVVAELAAAAGSGVEELRDVEAVLGALPRTLVDLAEWVAATYGSTLARALALVAPPAARPARAERWLSLAPDPLVEPTARQQEVLALLGRAGGALPRRQVLEDAATTAATLARMVARGLLRDGPQPVQPAAPAAAGVELTEAQGAAVAACLPLLERGGGDVLLHGVTGSGKTEVYLRVIEHALALGRGAIVLVPEIALTPQTAGRVAERFGATVAVLHSGLASGARAREWQRAADGEARVVVGARLAVFAPVPDLGVIVVDEEHDASYKHDADPRYDARRVAAKRGRLEGALVVYGSATPRPESWQGIRPRLALPARVGGRLPAVQLVDLRRDGGYPLTRPLLDALGDVEDRGGRAILLQNRRGAAHALHCRTCATSWRCDRCDVALSLHAGGLRCHHCGRREPVPRVCPVCGSVDLARIGAGTEAVERTLRERFPGLRVLRLDADVAARAGEPAATLDRFRDEPRALLIGTQIVAKGHDVPGVRVAAVLDAELGLAVPDFRADERTFALLTQLAGRPGRPGDPPGRVLVQAWNPDARPVALAARHAVPEFLESELQRRRELAYPPFRRLVRVLVTAPDEPLAEDVAQLLAQAGGRALPGDVLLGPAPLFRLRDRARRQLLIKTERPGRVAAVYRDLLTRLAADLRRAGARAVVDVDPQSMG